MKLFTVKNMIKMFGEMIKGLPKFDKDYSLVRFVYDNGEVARVLKMNRIIKSDVYTNIEIELVDVPANELADHDYILRDQSVKKMEAMNEFVNKNTKEYEFANGKMIKGRDGVKKLTKKEMKELV